MNRFDLWLMSSVMVCLIFSGCTSGMSRGSERSLYTIAGVLEVHREDIGKDIQLVLDQKLLFSLEADPEAPGQWQLEDYDRRTMLLLSDTPRVPSDHWGVLLQARAMGSGYVKLRFVPDDTTQSSRDIRFNVSIRR
jgi:hypothetical protein